VVSDDQNPNVDWWCWTENEPSTFRCRERHHDVRPSRGDPSTETWRAALGQSTSAQLRQTQAALAASQADLTRVEAERDAMALLNAELKAALRALSEKEGTS
jgi:hypothetical protein